MTLNAANTELRALFRGRWKKIVFMNPDIWFLLPVGQINTAKGSKQEVFKRFRSVIPSQLSKAFKKGRYKPLRQCTRQILCLYTSKRTVTSITEVQDYDRDTMSHLCNGNLYLIYISLENTCWVSSFHGNYGRTCPRVLKVDRHNSEGIHNVLL